METAATPADRRHCPGDESLIAYLLAETPGLGAPTARAVGHDVVAAHVGSCDRCVAELRVVRSRLALAAEVDAPVPAAVRARLAAPAPAPSPVRVAAAPGLLARLAAAFRLPLLVPAAAALALVAVATGLERGRAPLPEESTRDVPLRQPARVTAPAATVHADPRAAAAATAVLGRGDAVVLLAEQDGWYRVELGDGRAGWMERSAFE